MNFASLPHLGILGQPDPEELWSEMLDHIDIRPNMKFLNVAAGHGTEAKLLAKRLVASGYYTKEQAIDSIYLIDKYLQFTNPLKRMGFKNVIQEDFLTWNTDMKFDVVLGNPPYGKNANLAIKFLNKSRYLSDNIAFIVPQTFKKTSAVNRIDENLTLVEEIDNCPNTFDIGVVTCTQFWRVCNVKRPKIVKKQECDDFQFTNKSDADLALGRVGFGPCGKVFTDFEKRSENSHYFLKIKDQSVVSKLRSLEHKFRTEAGRTSGNLSLAKTELIEIYLSE